MCHINENPQDDSKCYVLYKHVLNLLFLEFFGIGLHRFWEPVNAQTLRMHFFRTLKQYEHIRDRTRFRYFALYGFSYSISALFLYFGRKCVQLRKYSRIQLSFTISHVHSSKWCRNKWKGAFSLQNHPIEEFLNRSIGTRLLFDRSCVSVLHSTKTWDTYNAWTIISKWPLNEYWTYIHMNSLDQQETSIFYSGETSFYWRYFPFHTVSSLSFSLSLFLHSIHLLVPIMYHSYPQLEIAFKMQCVYVQQQSNRLFFLFSVHFFSFNFIFFKLLGLFVHRFISSTLLSLPSSELGYVYGSHSSILVDD